MREKIIKFYTNNEELEFDVNLIHKLVLLINEKLIDIKKSSNPIVFIEMILLEFMNNSKMNFQSIKSQEVSSNQSNSFKIDGVSANNVSYESVDIKGNNSDFITEKSTQKIDEKSNILESKEKFSSTFDESVSDSNKNVDDDTKLIQNIDEIMKVRVHNTLAMANKQLLMKEISNLDLFNDYTFDSEIGYLACSILDSKIRAVSDQNIIISYEYDSIVKQNLTVIDKLIQVYNQITNSNKKLAIISDSVWENVKKEYISNIKAGINYELQDEPEEIFIEEKNNDIISNNAIELFGDIVEIK